LHEANFPDWQNYLHSDTELISRMMRFILDYQNEEYGYFQEVEIYQREPLMARMASSAISFPDGEVNS
jgi:hypothetical protein